MKKIFLMILLAGYILCTSSFATTDTLSFSCNTGSGLSKSIVIGASSNITVNWGDGENEQITVTLVNNYGEAVLRHTYSGTDRYNVSISAEDIRKIEAREDDILSINLTSVPLIRELYVDNNKIDSLNLANNLELEYMTCANNNLNQLKVWSSNIKKLNCNNNKLSSLDIPSSLQELYVSNNSLETLDLSTFSELICLECTDNSIKNLVIGASNKLEKLNITNNFISNIALTNNIALKEFYCNSNEIKSLNLTSNINIEKVNCTYNKLETVTLGNNSNLKELYVFGNDKISTVNLNNLNLEIVAVDKDVNITNDNSQCRIKISINGDGGVSISDNKELVLSTIPYSIYVNGEYIPLETNILDIREYSGEKNIDIQFYIFGGYDDFNINRPQLLEGMIPVKYNGTSWIITNSKDTEWYNYKNKKWANVMLRDDAKYLDLDGVTLMDIGNTSLDSLIGREVPEENTGSMYVWIPRFSYKIGENIDIKFSDGLVDHIDDGYTLHPAFNYASYKGGDTSDSDNYDSLGFQDRYLGMWVAKYSAGGNTSTPKYASNVEKIRDFSVGEAFIKSKLTGTSATYKLQNARSHMIKNTEWGAVAYLTTAIGDMKSDSTTGNKYGIFNMNDNVEYVSTFIELVGGVSNLNVRENGKMLIPYAMLKYYLYTPILESKDIELIKLRKAQDNNGINYNVFSKFYGIAMNEIGLNISGPVTKVIPHEDNTFLIRGINGIYSYSGSTGISDNDVGFRNVIFGNGINNEDSSEYFVITAKSNYGGKVSPYGNITVKEGKNLIYSIVPSPGYEVLDIVVDGNSEIYDNSDCVDHFTYYTYEFKNISDNHEIYVEFDDQVAPYDISVEKYIKDSGPNEGVATVEGDGEHNSRSIVTIKVNPILGYRLINWEVPSDLDNLEAISSNELRFRMPSRDISIKAIFEIISDVVLTVENQNSSVNMNRTVGEEVEVTAGEIDGYRFGNWIVSGIELTEEQKANSTISFVMPPNNVKLSAKYNKLSDVNLVLGDNTSVKFEAQETKDITFVAPSEVQNKTFSGWKIAGYVYLDIGNGIVLTMPEDSINIETIYQ